MATIFSGECIGKAMNIDLGSQGKIKFDMLVTQGEHKGKTAQYSGKLTPEQIKWTRRDMLRVGWQGKNVNTFADDVKKADLEIAFTAEPASFTRPDGTVSEWTSVKFRGAPSKPTVEADKAEEMNRWFAEAAAEDGAAAGGQSDSDTPF